MSRRISNIIKQQLKKFYAETQPGLTAKELRAALRYDYKAVSRSLADQRLTYSGGSLAGEFLWSDTPEGNDYWYRRQCCSGSAHWDSMYWASMF